MHRWKSRVFGDNLDTLRSLAARVENLLRNTDGTIYIDNPVDLLKSDIKVDINKEKAQLLGIQTVNIDKTVRLAVAGLNMGKYTDENDKDYSILLTRTKEEIPTLDVFNNLYVNNNQGVAVPVGQVSALKLETSPQVINHQEKKRVVSVKASVKKGFLVDRVIQQVTNKMDKMVLPAGYTYEMGGEVESRKDSFGGFTSIIIVTVFLFIAALVFIIWYIQKHADRIVCYSARCGGCCDGFVDHGQFTILCIHHRTDRTGRYRSKEYHSAGRFHQSAAQPGQGSGIRDPRSGGSSFSPHRADLPHGHWRTDAHRAFHQSADCAAGHRADRRIDQFNAFVPDRNTGYL